LDVPGAADVLLSALKISNTRNADERLEIKACLVQALSVFTTELETECYSRPELRNLLSEVIEHRPMMRTLISQVMGVFGNGEHPLSSLPS
jgi:hypothetical protein